MLTHRAILAILLGASSLLAADTIEARAWDVLTQAIKARGEESTIARELLGAIDDAKSRALIDSTFKSEVTWAIDDVAVGLAPAQCRHYLAELGKSALDPRAPHVLNILVAIARAGTSEAAQVLLDIGEQAGQPTAGVAFGLLGEKMGTVAEPLLIRTVTNGGSVRSRQTAAEILRRKKVPDALAAFRSALHDSEEKVRMAGALGLLQFGYQDGRPQIEAAAGDTGNEYHTEALVALATLGRSEAFDSLRALVTGPDEGVRARTVWAIAGSGNARLKEFAFRLGLDRQPIFRGMFAEKLLDPNDPQDRSVLQDMITTGDEMSQLIAVERLLGTKISARAEPIVARALVSGNEAVRQLAVQIASGHPALRPELAKRLASPDPNVQIPAFSAIADLHQQDRSGRLPPI